MCDPINPYYNIMSSRFTLALPLAKERFGWVQPSIEAKVESAHIPINSLSYERGYGAFSGSYEW